MTLYIKSQICEGNPSTKLREAVPTSLRLFSVPFRGVKRLARRLVSPPGNAKDNYLDSVSTIIEIVKRGKIISNGVIAQLVRARR